MGLAALLALGPDDLVLFFDRFFALPDSVQRAYLSGRTDLPGTSAAMGCVRGTARAAEADRRQVRGSRTARTPRGRPQKTGLRARLSAVNRGCRYCGPAESPGAYRFRGRR